MARAVRAKRMKHVPLADLQNDLPRLSREAEAEEIVITRDGKPAGVLIGFASDEDWLGYGLEHDPRFLTGIEQARTSLRAAHGIKLEDIEEA
jgi:prevent-host-death family protein